MIGLETMLMFECPSCGATLQETQKFCHLCGAAYPPPKKTLYCTNCGSELLEDAVFCGECGKSVLANDKPSPSESIAQPTSFFASSRLCVRHSLDRANFFKKLVLLLLSVCLLVSLFMPVLVLVAEPEDDEDLKLSVGFTLLDSGIFLMDSTHDIAGDDIEDDDFCGDVMDEYKDFIDDQSDLWDEYGEDYIEHVDIDETSGILKKLLRVAVRSEAIDTTSNMGVAFVLSLAYAAVVLLLFVFALLSFVSMFNPAVRDYEAWCIGLVAAVPALILSVYAALSLSEYVSAISFYYVIEKSIGGWMVAMMIASVSVVLLFAIWRVFSKKPGACDAWDIVKRVAVCLVSGAIVWLSFSSLFSVNAEVKFVTRNSRAYYDSETHMLTSDNARREASMPMDAEMFSLLNTSSYINNQFVEMKEQEKRDVIKREFSHLCSFEKDEYEEGKAILRQINLIRCGVLAFGVYEYSWLFGLGNTAVVLIVLSAGLLFAKNLQALTHDETISGWWTIPAKSILTLSAVIVSSLSIIIAGLIFFNTTSEFSVVPRLTVLMLLILSAVLSCVPMRRSRVDGNDDSIHEQM